MPNRRIPGGVKCFASGLMVALRAPVLLVVFYGATLAAALPFAVMLEKHLAGELARTHPEREVPDDIDAEWWLEFRRHATGLAATFTPNVIGVAAPLDNLSAVLDATPRPWIVVMPIVVYALLSAFLWGGVLERLRRRRSIGVRAFAAAGRASFARVLAVNVIAVAFVALAYLIVHPLLFGPVHDLMSSLWARDPSRIVTRLVLYAIFGGLLLTASVIADYARIHAVLTSASSVRAAYAGAFALVRTRFPAVSTVLALTSVAFVVLLVGYGFIELEGGARIGGWRAVALGQAFIVGRLALRLINTAAELEVVLPRALPQTSLGPS